SSSFCAAANLASSSALGSPSVGSSWAGAAGGAGGGTGASIAPPCEEAQAPVKIERNRIPVREFVVRMAVSYHARCRLWNLSPAFVEKLRRNISIALELIALERCPAPLRGALSSALSFVASTSSPHSLP